MLVLILLRLHNGGSLILHAFIRSALRKSPGACPRLRGRSVGTMETLPRLRGQCGQNRGTPPLACPHSKTPPNIARASLPALCTNGLASDAALQARALTSPPHRGTNESCLRSPKPPMQRLSSMSKSFAPCSELSILICLIYRFKKLPPGGTTLHFD